ncbi:MAG: hypothetical protein DHS20C04_26000 [Hyphococcus sp.]|nr:MAG: hypothetical protein DHS20C04_26000 [Marinicaulis sp.]
MAMTARDAVAGMGEAGAVMAAEAMEAEAMEAEAMEAEIKEAEPRQMTAAASARHADRAVART